MASQSLTGKKRTFSDYSFNHETFLEPSKRIKIENDYWEEINPSMYSDLEIGISKKQIKEEKMKEEKMKETIPEKKEYGLKPRFHPSLKNDEEKNDWKKMPIRSEQNNEQYFYFFIVVVFVIIFFLILANYIYSSIVESDYQKREALIQEQIKQWELENQ
jgi:hypothetical protein